MDKIRIIQSILLKHDDTGDLYYIEAAGEASETKPTSGVATGSIFWACDANGAWKVYMFNESTQKWTDREGNEG